MGSEPADTVEILEELHLDIDGVTPEQLIQVELNIESVPLFLPIRGKRDGVKTCRERIVAKDGTRLEREWHITASQGSTLPGAFDQDVYVAVKQLVHLRGGMSQNGELVFSIYELLDLMGRNRGGRNYEQVKDSLDRIASTTIRSKNAFYSKETEQFENKTFHVWSVSLQEQRRGRKFGADRNVLTFHSLVLRSFQSEHLKRLDTRFYRSLSSSLARRLYRLIDVRRGSGITYREHLLQLRDLVPLSSSYKQPSRVKEKLQNAHEDLLKGGYLSGIDYVGSEVIYRVDRRFVRQRRAIEICTTAEERIALNLLRSNGVWPEKALQLVHDLGSERCQHAVSLLPHFKHVRNSGAWLVTVIESGRELPPVPDPGSGEGSQSALDLSEASFPLQFSAEDRFESAVEDPEGRELLDQIVDLAADCDDVTLSSIHLWMEGFKPVSVTRHLAKGIHLSLMPQNDVAGEYFEETLSDRLSPFVAQVLGSSGELKLVVA